MRLKLLLAIILSFLFVSSVYGQDLKYIENLYGSSKSNIWEVRKDLLMFARFDNDDKICKAVFQPNRFSENTVLLGRKYIDLNQAKYVIDAIAPPDSRGKVIVDDVTDMGGGVATTMYIYDKLSIFYYASMDVYFDTVDKDVEKNTNTKNSSNQTEQNEKPSIKVSGTEVIVINWTKRQCVEK